MSESFILASPSIPVGGGKRVWPSTILPRRLDGLVKSRFSWEEKLHILDPTSTAEQTLSRLVDFTGLFAFRPTRAIITKAGGGPRDWAELKHGPLKLSHVARHLIGARASPSLRPQWVGARSYRTSLYFGIDVDHGHGPSTDFGPFHSRCRLVEKALRRMGIDPSDPGQILIVPTPSGGRHYYVFFDGVHLLCQYHALLDAAGLRHEAGEIEYFPSETKGLRLPFGHIPLGPHHPADWIQFIDDFRNGGIRRHSLEVLRTRLGRTRRAATVPPPRPVTKEAESPTVSGMPGLGLSKQSRSSLATEPGPSHPPEAPADRYRQLLQDGVHTLGEAEELLRVGIRLKATRNTVLKILAAHLIWFRHLPEEEAAEFLTRWALDRRHESEDIRHDLDHGSSRVSDQIRYLCRWYAREKGSEPTASRSVEGHASYARAELSALKPSIDSLPPKARRDQAHFLLHLLGYAKMNGRATDDQSGWEVAVAINPVVKSWPGCGSKNYYKVRMNRAQEAGLLAVVREKWQNPRGAGRARTYRLSLPVVDRGRWDLGYREALGFLVESRGESEADHLGDEHREPGTGVTTHEPPGRSRPIQGPNQWTDPRPLHPGGAGRGLGPGPHQRGPEQAQVEALPDPHPGTGPAPAASSAGTSPAIGRVMRRQLGPEPPWDTPLGSAVPGRMGGFPGPPATSSQDQAIDQLRREYLDAARRHPPSLTSESPDRGEPTTPSGSTSTAKGRP
jgi:hypothetical protein